MAWRRKYGASFVIKTVSPRVQHVEEGDYAAFQLYAVQNRVIIFNSSPFFIFSAEAGRNDERVIAEAWT